MFLEDHVTQKTGLITAKKKYYCFQCIFGEHKRHKRNYSKS